MPIIVDSGSIMTNDAVSMATVPDFYSDSEQATRTLRRIAARNLGLDYLMEHGTVEEYRNLTASQQVALTDEMAYLISKYPNSFPVNIQAAADDRVESPMFRQPLADASYSQNLMNQVANGEFINNAFGGGAEYLKSIGILAGVAIITIAALK